MTNEELVLLYQGSHEKKYIEQLYLQNENLIFSIANKYSGLYEIEDLIQEGFIGLLDSANRWDKYNGVNFSSYAYKVIRSHLLRTIHNESNVIRIPEYKRVFINDLKNAIDIFYKKHGREPKIEELADILKQPPTKIEELLSDILLLQAKSCDEVISEEDDSLTLGDTLEDPNNPIEQLEKDLQNEQLKKVLWGIIDDLEPLQRQILHERYENNQSTNDISEKLNISTGKINNLESRAFRELRKHNNRAKLKPFFDESELFSMSIKYAGYGYFKNTWTSSPEKAILIYESLNEQKIGE